MELSELLQRLNNLKRTPRTGWISCNIPLGLVEDVAQHSFEVTSLTLLLCIELENRGRRIDRGKALSMAVLHDWPETMTGDLPRSATDYLEKNVKEKIERKAMENILAGILGGRELTNLWEEYLEKKTDEAKIVYIADRFSMLVQALKYWESGNRSRRLEELWLNVERELKSELRYFPEIRAILSKLRRGFTQIR